MSPVSIATSVPLPIAMPIFALANAGASFIPSPTIPTNLPRFCNSSIFLALSCGNTSAITSSIPTCFAMVFAVLSLSPVIINMDKFISFSFLIAFLEYFLRVSATPIKPMIFLSSAIITVVFPFSSRFLILFSTSSISILFFFISFLFPTSILLPLYEETTP